MLCCLKTNFVMSTGKPRMPVCIFLQACLGPHPADTLQSQGTFTKATVHVCSQYANWPETTQVIPKCTVW